MFHAWVATKRLETFKPSISSFRMAGALPLTLAALLLFGSAGCGQPEDDSGASPDDLAVTQTITPTATTTPVASDIAEQTRIAEIGGPEPTEKTGATTPTPTALPVSAACPVDEGACATAELILGSVQSFDVDGLLASAQGIEVQCAEDMGEFDPYHPLCADHAGKTVVGFSIGGFHYAFVAEAELRGWLDGLLAQGQASGARYEIASIGCYRPAEGEPTSCETAFAVGIASTEDGAESGTLVFAFVRDSVSGEPALWAVRSWLPGGAVVRGGSDNLGFEAIRGLPGDTWFMPWNPSAE